LECTFWGYYLLKCGVEFILVRNNKICEQTYTFSIKQHRERENIYIEQKDLGSSLVLPQPAVGHPLWALISSCAKIKDQQVIFVVASSPDN
jgi:hypothetical protein